jgi:MFS family permease
MGYLGGVFGVASIAGPFLGGWITDNFSWRWLFYVNLPIGVAALVFIVAYLHVPHTPRRHKLDYVGFAALPLALVAVLLATTWGAQPTRGTPGGSSRFTSSARSSLSAF